MHCQLHVVLTMVLMIFGAVHSAPWSGLPAGTVTFGQTAAFSGSWTAGAPYTRGLRAAFHETNQKGGVNGRTLELLSLDDEYNATKTTENANSFVANPNVFAMIGASGTPPTIAAAKVAYAANMPFLAPMSGSGAVREPFNEKLINIRVSYDDEIAAWMRFMIGVKHFKRISLILTDNACCWGTRDFIIATMKTMKLELASVHHYNIPDIPTLDYDAYAADVWKHRPQGIMMFTASTFTNRFLEAIHKIQTYPITYISGSWAGDDNLNYMRDNKHLDFRYWHTTQISPHPKGESALAKNYRKAMHSLHGTGVQLDFLSMEGYMAGRFVALALERTPDLTRENFLKAIYSTKLFGIDNLLAGPYSNDCVYDPGTAVGQSSLCNCNTGLRFVTVNGVDASYEHVETGISSSYPMTECKATHNSVTRPILLANTYPTNIAADGSQVAVERLRLGMHLDKKLNAIAKPLPVDVSLSNSTIKAIETFSDNHPVLGVIAGMPVPHQPEYPVFPVYGQLPVHELSFHRETIHLFATIQQQIYVAANYIAVKKNVMPVHVLLSDAASKLSAGDELTLQKMCENSFESFGLVGATISTFSSSTLASTLSALPSSAQMLIYGITNPTEFNLVLDTLEASPQVDAFMAFNEIMELNTVLESRYPLANGPNATSNSVPSRLHIATNLPLWSGSSEFATKYQGMMKDANLEANITDPAFFVGYYMAKLMEFMVTRTNGDASPSAFMEELYRTSVVSMDGVSLGPYIAEQCTSEDCLCNAGARVVKLETVSGYRYGIASDIMTTRFSKCHVQYQLKVPAAKSYTAAIAAGVAVPVVVLAGLVVAAVVVSRHLKVANAPKDVSKFHTMFVQLKKETLLWERQGGAMPRIMKEYHSLVKKATDDNKCYIVKHIGGATLIAANSADQILHCAADTSKALRSKNWSKLLSDSRDQRTTLKLERSDRSSANNRKGSVTRKSTVRTYNKSDNNTATGSTHHSRNTDGSTSKSMDDIVDIVQFSVGVHFDNGIATYNEALHSYDYSGPAVDGAAVAADKARGDQILVTDKVSQKGVFSSCFVEFCTSDWGKGTIFNQFNIPGMAVRSFSADDSSDDANVDSIAATLEQQSAGVTKKRAIIVSIHLNSIQEKANTMPHATFARYLTSKLEQIRIIVKEHKGHIHSFLGSRFIISFNAVSPTPQATMRACTVVQQIKDLEAIDDYQVSAGLASETSLVGSLQIEDWKVDAIVSEANDMAGLLQRQCERYPDTHCLTQQSLYDELNLFSVVEYVDVVRHPNSAKPRLMISIHDMKEREEGEEWMYAIENGDAGNPHFGVNEIYHKILRDGTDLDSVQQLVSALPSETHEFPGCQNLFELVECLKEKSGDRDAAIEDYLSRPNIKLV